MESEKCAIWIRKRVTRIQKSEIYTEPEKYNMDSEKNNTVFEKRNMDSEKHKMNSKRKEA